MKQRRRKTLTTEKSADGHRRKKVSNILSKSVRDAIYLESKTCRQNCKFERDYENPVID